MNNNTVLLVVFGWLLKIIGFVLCAVGFLSVLAILSQGGRLARFIDSLNDLLVGVGVFFALCVFIFIGYALLQTGKRLLSKSQMLSADELEVQTIKEPILYLRPFKDDNSRCEFPLPITGYENIKLPQLSSEEEQLLKGVKGIGNFYAIAKPFKVLPDTGAIRIFPGKQNWENIVKELMISARLVLIRVGDGENLWWEIEEAMKIVKPERLVFLLPNDESVTQDFLNKIQSLVLFPMPVVSCKESLNTTLCAILYFNNTGIPHIQVFDDSAYRHDLTQPLRSMFRIALKPVLMELGLKWTPPPVPLQLISTFLFHFWGVCVCTGWIIYIIWDSNWGDIIFSWFFLMLITITVIVSFSAVVKGRLLYSAITEFNDK